MRTKTFLSIYYYIKSSCLKPTKTYVILSILLSLMIGSSCEIFTDEKVSKKCEASKWDPWDIKIHILHLIRNNSVGPTPTHNLIEALDLRFIGTIRNIDCMGNEEGYFDIDSTVFPSFLWPKPDIVSSYPFHVSPYYFPFRITNFYEYFTISFTMRATFKDGLVLQSTQVSYNTTIAQWLWEEGNKKTITVPVTNVSWSVYHGN